MRHRYTLQPLIRQHPPCTASDLNVIHSNICGVVCHDAVTLWLAMQARMLDTMGAPTRSHTTYTRSTATFDCWIHQFVVSSIHSHAPLQSQPCQNLLALHSAEDLVLAALLQWTRCSLSSSIGAWRTQKDCLSHNAENGFVGMGIGAAMTGLRPVIEGMNMGFLLLAYNQISNNAGMLHYTSGGQFKVSVE